MSHIFSVGQLNLYLSGLLEEDPMLCNLLVRGEVTDCHTSGGGHLFFTLKDGQSSIACVAFAKTAERLRHLPQNGQMGVVSGQCQVRPKDSACVLQLLDFLPEGQGRAQQQKEALKAQLEQAGCFSPHRKREIPFLPQKIGLLTGADTAALADLTRVFAEEYPMAHLVHCPVLVQGEKAPDQIAAGFEALAVQHGCQVIICARGGGSAQDLEAFDAKQVVLAAVQCPCPVISAVGHESDWSLLDLAADLRVPTPTAAAKVFGGQWAKQQSHLAQTNMRFARATAAFMLQKEQQLQSIGQFLRLLQPARLQAAQAQKLLALQARLHLAAANQLAQKSAGTQALAERLQGAGPESLLARGYAYIKNQTNPDGSFAPGDEIQIITADQLLNARVQSAHRRQKEQEAHG